MKRPPMSSDTKAKMSLAAQNLWLDPKYREKISEAQREIRKKAWADPVYRAKMAGKVGRKKAV